MKAKDIVVGKIYKNTKHPRVGYLGIAVFGKTDIRKKLVIINSSRVITRTVVSYKDNPSFWNDFVLTNKKIRVR